MSLGGAAYPPNVFYSKKGHLNFSFSELFRSFYDSAVLPMIFLICSFENLHAYSFLFYFFPPETLSISSTLILLASLVTAIRVVALAVYM